jgi:hypothetical protein
MHVAVNVLGILTVSAVQHNTTQHNTTIVAQAVHKQELGEITAVPGRAIAQAVSRRLPTAAARVQTRVWSCGIL